jgi:D-beta-D-heptose 7-phosphate kinase/D-beta-D-heptose 1-phosphate adenosyltransferase
MQLQEQLKILLIGDSCIDRYTYGEVNRLNPEAPVPILDYKRTEVRQGMAWNVFNNLKSFNLTLFQK